ncbi:DNA-binding CsgD family transcriptional regulator [Kineococcus radiotolerans]|uniref:Regulatory protein LuxR n=2 Tax=Kineococcus radiotolerans TaxID=131568 RepID=A6WBL2_KINRD|nr:LuxR family transcriptional regulator [Kineococcus radiotolerans]ABS04201.1 regulatory protein LuxR [Kineococcus radiotolerans SRS30216 = ATCC BAA-149]MBB2903455.1 DNA-binding CsgD family transcriptional regulator [Kineococcus radiotolerans]
MVGRDAEIDALDRLMDDVQRRGAAVLVRGEAGIGKSALLHLACGAAAQRGLRVLRASGVESETTLPFAGLHQLVRSLFGRLPALPAPQRRALMAAFRMTDDAAPELFLIGLAALNLISDSAADQPLVLVVDDAHWLDRPSADVLGFVARRLESEAVVLVAAQRDDFPPVLTGPGLEEQHLERLDRRSAEEVLARRAPQLDPIARGRLLDVAAGNPLALVELPLEGPQDDFAPPTLTARLEHAFAARLPGLPGVTRDLLLVAALEEERALGESLAAAAALRGHPVTVEALVPATEVGLVAADGGTLTFRHPLVRHAIRQQATLPERQRAHLALARTLPEPDRQVWHRAAAADAPDDALAAELEEAGARAQRRGGVAAAQAAVERAARLSADPVQRTRRYLRAAELAFEWGRPDVVDRLLQETAALGAPARELIRMTVIRERSEEGIQGAGTRRLTEVAAAAAADGRTDQALLFLHAAALRCMWAGASGSTRARVLEVVEQALDPDDVLALEVVSYAAPLERGAVLHERLRAHSSGPLDPERTHAAGMAASVVGDLPLSVELLTSAVPGLRADGRLGLLGRVLMVQSWNALNVGRFDLAATAADEAVRLAADTEQPLVRAIALVVQAAVSALRSAEDVEERLVEAARLGLQVESNGVLAVVQFARGAVALNQGRHEEAWDALVRLSDPTDPAYHPVVHSFSVGDLVEAAVQSGHRAEVEPLLADLEALAALTPSAPLHLGLRYGRALLAPEDEAEELFAAALAADLSSWPFARARLHLAHGAWLRRQRRAAESRAPLRAARDALDALGAAAWGDRARQELRASGEQSRPRTPEAREQLSPQELLVAQLAAEGLTNREIGARLYLSHRTVGTHLHRIFPKLGITSRVALRAALGR